MTQAIRLDLPAVLDTAAVSSLRLQLLEARGQNVGVNGQAVERAGALCLQALVSAANLWRADHHRFAIAMPSPALTEAARLTGLTVDDSRTMRDMLRFALIDAGFRVTQAEDGVHGLEVLRQQPPHVIVTDINMPRLDGFGFIEAVRRDATYKSIPILVLTSEGDAEKKARARRAGATGWIVKPFDPPKLIAAIRRVAA